MRIAGIVAEYNPFHSGHQYHIEATRRLLGGDCGVVCVMSGNWVQRGECAVTDKWKRTGTALRSGADLVLELPTVWAAASAESFARGAVSALAATGVVNTLSFGSELGEVAPLRAVAECLDSEVYRAGLRRFLDEGMSFAACRQAVVAGILGREASDCLSNPNNNLAVEYLRAMPKGMEAVTVRRVGAGHDGAPEGGHASASALRDWIRTGRLERGRVYLPEPWQGDVASMEWCERAALARLRSMTLADAQRLPDSGEGLAARLLSAGGRARSLGELYDLAKTKRYAHARIRRLVLWAFLGLTAADRPGTALYLRVLGMNEKGCALLRTMREKASVPVITKPAHAKSLTEEGRRLFELEARCTDLFGLCFAAPRPAGAEWTTNPVVVGANSAASVNAGRRTP